MRSKFSLHIYRYVMLPAINFVLRSTQLCCTTCVVARDLRHQSLTRRIGVYKYVYFSDCLYDLSYIAGWMFSFNMERQKILIDTDMMLDNALAIIMGLALPNIEIVGITCVASRNPIETTVTYSQRLLALAGRQDIEVVAGAAFPLFHEQPGRRKRSAPAPWNKIDLSSLPEIDGRPRLESAPSFIVKTAENSPGLTILAIGPLTNIATALQCDSKVLRRSVKEIVIMGGAIRVPGNATPVAETNIFYDPEAAHIVFNSGINLRLVPLDVTTKVIFKEEDLPKIPKSRVGEFCRHSISQSLIYQKSLRKMEGFQMHDPLAMCIISNPTLVTSEDIYLTVETKGELTRGALIADVYHQWHKRPNARVAIEIEPRELIDLFLNCLKAY